MNKRRQLIVITQGDPAGIGPEVIIKALNKPAIRKLANFLLIGDKFIFERAGRLKPVKGLQILDMANVPRCSFEFGKIKGEYGRAAAECVLTAVALIMQKKAAALVTGPICKEAFLAAGFKFAGHTEFLAQLAKSEKIAMMFVGGPLKITLVTRHLPLSKVAKALTPRLILDTVELTYEALRKNFKIKTPKIGVCGLNPHAGEGGVLGIEERKIITPAIKKAKKYIPYISGPHPADSLFYKAYHGEFDAVICMYHDQGLGPLKMIARDEGVNVTLGLPFVRTSPDHGTAFDIAGRGIANSHSMEEAIKLAVRMSR